MKKTMLALCMTLAVASTGAMAQTNDNEIRIGVINPLTGPSKDIGIGAKLGASLAAAEINARGGINGKKIVLVSYDDKATPAYAEEVAREMVKNGKLHAVLGGVNTGVVVKTSPIFQAAKLPTMITAAIGSLPAVLNQYLKEDTSYIFRSQPPDYIQAATIVREIKEHGYKRVVLYADATPFGESGVLSLTKLLKDAGIDLVHVERYKVDSSDFEQYAQNGRVHNPDATIVWGIGFDQAALRTAMLRVGWRPPYFGSYTLAQQDFLNTTYASGNGSKMTMAFTLDSSRPTAQHFADNYLRYANASRFQSPQSAAAGYDGMYLMGLAIQQAGSLEGEKIVRALENLEKPYYGVQKDFIKPFSKGNHEGYTSTEGLFLATAKDGDAWQYPDLVNTTLFTIKKRGQLVLGVRESSGLSYNRGDGKYVGFHTEMAERIAEDIRKNLGLQKLDIKYQPVTTQNRIAMVAGGTVDLECGSTTNTQARQRDVSFAATTYVGEVRIATRATAGIGSIRDLAGKTVAVTEGTTSLNLINKARVGEFKVVYGKDHAESFKLLEEGKADAFVMDSSILAANISKSKTPGNFKIVGDPLSVEPIACMMHRDDPTFKTMVDASIKRQIADGSLAVLYDKWLMQPVPPNNVKIGLPLSSSTRGAWANPNDNPVETYNK